MITGHYTREEWTRYRANSLPEAVRRQMEEHLSACDRCLEIYLSCIGEQEIELADVFLPRDFAAKTLRMFVRRPRDHRRTASESPGYLEALRNYAIAAVVTAMLLGGGWFTATPKAITSAFLETGQSTEVAEETLPSRWAKSLADKINGWVEKAVDSTVTNKPLRPF